MGRLQETEAISKGEGVLSHNFYSMTPFKCGPGCVKYCLRPLFPKMPWLSAEMEPNREAIREYMIHNDLEYEMCMQASMGY